jgi:hypothetical protein
MRVPPPAESDRLVLPDGRELTIDEVGVWNGAERFRAFRHERGGRFDSFEGLLIGLKWDEEEKCWRYPSATTQQPES